MLNGKTEKSINEQHGPHQKWGWTQVFSKG